MQKQKGKEHFVFCWNETYLVKPPLVWALCDSFLAAIYPGTWAILVSTESKAMQWLERARIDSSLQSSVMMAKVLSSTPLHRHRLWDGAQALPAKTKLALSPNSLKTSSSIIACMFMRTGTKSSINHSTKNAASKINAGVPACTQTHSSRHYENTPNN